MCVFNVVVIVFNIENYHDSLIDDLTMTAASKDEMTTATTGTTTGATTGATTTVTATPKLPVRTWCAGTSTLLGRVRPRVSPSCQPL